MKTALSIALLLGLAAPSFAAGAQAATKTREASIRSSLVRRFGDGPPQVTYHTSGSAKVNGSTITFSPSRIGFTGSTWQGNGGGTMIYKGFATFATGKRMKLTLTSVTGP
jgi:hypothetical protein